MHPSSKLHLNRTLCACRTAASDQIIVCLSISINRLAESRVLNVGMTPMRQILPYVMACSIVIGIMSVSADFYSVQPTPMMSSDGTPPSLPEAVSRMVEYRRWHDNALREYEARRLFQASNRRFKMESTMEVQNLFRW